MADAYQLLVTCEHGGCLVPREYRPLFRGTRQVLQSHRGYDIGALELARLLARQLDAPLELATVTRLLVDLNRSRRHRNVFSEFTATLGDGAKEAIVRAHYDPHRAAVESRTALAIAKKKVALHLGVHSFTPVLSGVKRNADVGLLFNPQRALERRWALAWQDALRRRRADLVVRRNYPYLGKSDGLTTHLRRRFKPESYAGLELEVNQHWPLAGGAAWFRLQRDLVASLQDALAVLRGR